MKTVNNLGLNTKSKRETVAIIGLGYVGLPLALLAEKQGYDVMGIDTDSAKVKNIKNRVAPYLNEEEQAVFKDSRLQVYENGDQLGEAEIVVVCVPTPVYDDRTPNVEPLRRASELVGSSLRSGQTIIIESTISPGVCEEIVLPILEKLSGLKAGLDFYFAHCPERIDPGNANWTVASIPRVVGANDPRSLIKAVSFYRSIIDAEILPMASLKEAEAVKMVENSFRDVNIAFVNELAMSFDRLNINLTHVLNAAASKPFAFLKHYAGCGVGGHCIPVDPYYLISYAAQNGFDHKFLSLAREINDSMPRYTVRLLDRLVKKQGLALKGAAVALLGLAYKRDVPDIRESPALNIRDELVKRGTSVRIFDPYLINDSNVTSVEEALSGAVGAIIATDHSLFRALTPEIFLRNGVLALVDGRNCLNQDTFLSAGLAIKGIGQ